MPTYKQQTIKRIMPYHVDLIYRLVGHLNKYAINAYHFFLKSYLETVDFQLPDEDDFRGVVWHGDAIEAAIRDTAKFFLAEPTAIGNLPTRAGECFAYARDGAGIAFTDTYTDFGEDAKRLQKLAQGFESVDAYKGSDGFLHTGSEIRYHLAGVMKLEGSED
jgi:hypothetical protein